MLRGHHLRDERLMDCYLAVRAGEPLDPPSAEHLDDCESCGTRYADLVQFMDDVRTEADLETDAIFTPERLRLQQQQIAARLEHVGQPAHVISFPSRVGRRVTYTATRVAPRWIAAAAAAGLFIGVALGRFLDLGTPVDQFQAFHLPAAVSTNPHGIASGSEPAEVVIAPAPVAEAQMSDDEDQFLSELELALERPRTYELRPFDAFTPHLRDAVNRLR
jgi:hypothetical protein